jgi:hypothetical protein
MVTSSKKAKKPAKNDLPKPDFKKGRKVVDKLIERNVGWLKEMDKR